MGKPVKGRKKGTTNGKWIFVAEGKDQVTYFLNQSLRDQRCQIRCNKGFIVALHSIKNEAPLLSLSEADILHKALKYYAIKECPWMDENIIKDI